MDSVNLFPTDFKKIIVELGMGDGRLIESLAKNDQRSLFIGIEIDSIQCREAKARITLDNVVILNNSFEDSIIAFPDRTIDSFISVLPDPAFIDRNHQSRWFPFYKILYDKLKRHGGFQIITETTNDLFQPVEDSEYTTWAEWLKTTFRSIGFLITTCYEGTPTTYVSRCLEQFRNDSKRIRMITLEMIKDDNNS